MSKWKCADYTCANKCEASDTLGLKPRICLHTGAKKNWEPIEGFVEKAMKEAQRKMVEKFGNSEQLPKLTADVFHRPDCPPDAKIAVVNDDRSASWGTYDTATPTEYGGWRGEPPGYWEEIPGKFDASDWQNSLIERLPDTMPEPEETDRVLHVRFKKLHPDAKAPYQATPGSAGFDLTAHSMNIKKDSSMCNLAEYGTGLAVEIPAGHVGLLFPRSSIYKADMLLTNGVGVIDSDYRGEIKAVFSYAKNGEFYKKGDRIAQLVIMPIPAVRFEEAEELSETERGAGGYGSTGR